MTRSVPALSLPRRASWRAWGVAVLLAIAWLSAQSHLQLHALAHVADLVGATSTDSDEAPCSLCAAFAHVQDAAVSTAPPVPAAHHLAFARTAAPARRGHPVQPPVPRGQGPPAAR
jgi:hypothetical protein